MMAKVMLLRHARRNRIGCAEEAMHAGLTRNGKQESMAFGRSLAKAFGRAGIGVVPSRLERCRQTAQKFRKGYGRGADILEPDQTGELTYIIPGMISMAKAGMGHTAVVRIANAGGKLERIPIMFEGDYGGAMERWLGGEFGNEFIRPYSIYEAVVRIAEASKRKSLVIFASDIQVSVVSSITGIREFLSRRPGYLEGIWTEDHATGNWRIFSLSDFMPAPMV
jgi:hypothetical protein